MSTKNKILFGLSIFIALTFIGKLLHLSPVVIFIFSGLGIIPLAAWISGATEEISLVLGPSIGGLLNATFGNATEMIISIVALSQGLIDVVKASLAGSIIANLLLALGLAIFFGGLRFKEQKFSPSVARINASSLTLSTIVLLTPSAIHLTSGKLPTDVLNKFSYATSILLLLFYGMMLYFSIKHQQDIEDLKELNEELAEEIEEEHGRVDKSVNMGLQVGLLLGLTVIMVFVSDVLVESLQEAIEIVKLTQLFTGIILIPIFSGVVEYITCVTFATKNKMEGAVAVAIGSSLQIALFVAPITVLVGWAIGQPMNLEFNLFSGLAVAVAVVITNSVSTDGRSNWLEGALLLITYIVLGIAFYFHP